MTKLLVNLDLYAECENCKEPFDLISHDSNDEGYWTGKLRAWLNNEKDADILNESVICPECCEEIKLTGIEY